MENMRNVMVCSVIIMIDHYHVQMYSHDVAVSSFNIEIFCNNNNK